MSKIILRKDLDFTNDICDYLVNTIKNNNKKKLAIIFDIDDTLIYTNKQNNEKIKKIYDLAIKYGIPVYIITARILNQANFDYTISELVNKGFKHFTKLFLMPISYLYQRQIGVYKYHVRQGISQKNRIILNIGDQWTDLFPNPTSIQKLSNDYYIFNGTKEGMLIKLKSLVGV